MTRKSLVPLFIFFPFLAYFAQTISGSFPQLAGQEIRLEGFSGLKTYPAARTITDEKGNFKINYSASDYGVGYLISSENKPLFVILNGEDLELKGETLGKISTLRVLKGKENQLFEQYAAAHPRREQALSAWVYLQKMYRSDSLFARHQSPNQAIQKEIERVKDEDASFLAALPKDSYVRWFLPTRKRVSSVSVVAQYRTEEIPATVAAFRRMDYAGEQLYKSGLFKEAIDSHFWLLENSGQSLEVVFLEMKVSIDALYRNAGKNADRLNEVTDYLFGLLEKHSHYRASEYLAVKVLNEAAFPLHKNLAQKLETYRKMKKGNTAPDILFQGALYAPGYDAGQLPKKLSEIKSKYTVLVFGSSWCPACTEELPQLAHFYPKWKQKGIETVFVSLDDNKEAYRDFVRKLPFVSTSDFKKWDSQAVKDYHVFETPAMYLLDSGREIILKPNSADQIDAWVTYRLGE